MGIQKPTVGRIVHYKSRGSADGRFPSVPRAAIITDVQQVQEIKQSEPGAPIEKGETRLQVRVCVLNPEGIFFSDWLDQGEAPGNWNWPPII